jgi:hypothetical protein
MTFEIFCTFSVLKSFLFTLHLSGINVMPIIFNIIGPYYFRVWPLNEFRVSDKALGQKRSYTPDVNIHISCHPVIPSSLVFRPLLCLPKLHVNHGLSSTYAFTVLTYARWYLRSSSCSNSPLIFYFINEISTDVLLQCFTFQLY